MVTPIGNLTTGSVADDEALPLWPAPAWGACHYYYKPQFVTLSGALS